MADSLLLTCAIGLETTMDPRNAPGTVGHPARWGVADQLSVGVGDQEMLSIPSSATSGGRATAPPR